MVLISRDSHESRLREEERAEVLVCVQVAVGCWIHIHHMEAWLVAMHGVQNHLEKQTSKIGKLQFYFKRNSNVNEFTLLMFLRECHRTNTYMSIVIQQVVCELESVKGHCLFHPLGSRRRRVWMEMHAARGCNICPPCHQPGGAVERVPDTHLCFKKMASGRVQKTNLLKYGIFISFIQGAAESGPEPFTWQDLPVSFVVNWDKIHEQNIFSRRIHPRDSHLESWEHPPAVLEYSKTINSIKVSGEGQQFKCKPLPPSRLSNNHLCSQLVKLLPKRLHLQLHSDLTDLGGLGAQQSSPVCAAGQR